MTEFDDQNAPARDSQVSLPAGEVLVAFPYKPAFPGVLATGTAPSATTSSVTTCPTVPGGRHAHVGLRCRRSVAQWIGVYLTSFYGSAQVRYEWCDDILAIYDDPWAYPEEQPQLIHPDHEGRYEIVEPWLGVSGLYAAELAQRHPHALVALAGDNVPGATPETTSAMGAYLCDHPGAHERQRDLIDTALADLGRQ